jgi:hypothetical protein
MDALAAAKANLGLMEQTRLLMSLQLSSPVASSLLTSVILWSMFLFCGFGVLSGTNPTTIVALALGAISVASAMFLVLDLTQPYSGLFRVSPSGRLKRSTNRGGTTPKIIEARRLGHLENNQVAVICARQVANRMTA